MYMQLVYRAPPSWLQLRGGGHRVSVILPHAAAPPMLSYLRLSYFFFHSEIDYIYRATGGAYSTSSQLQLHLLLYNKSNVSLRSYPPSFFSSLLYTQ